MQWQPILQDILGLYLIAMYIAVQQVADTSMFSWAGNKSSGGLVISHIRSVPEVSNFNTSGHFLHATELSGWMVSVCYYQHSVLVHWDYVVFSDTVCVFV